jgi:hypothetical protein
MLEAACHNISEWYIHTVTIIPPINHCCAKKRPDPTPGATVELGFLGSVLLAELPQTIDTQQLTDTPSFGQTYDPKIHVRYKALPILRDIWN